jgi:hypothetical protein
MRPLAFLILALAVSPAQADRAAAQRQALWHKLSRVEDLKAVDQIIFEGDTDGPTLTGTCEKRAWLSESPTVLNKRFYATVVRTCFQDVPGCFRITGVWSNGTLIASPD